ncbi:hypothetical protein GN956_G3880 [Arapaima gigas]
MASCSRFSDDGYKNWLKITMSLQLLRSRLCTFVENETETFYGALRSYVGNTRCQSGCDIKSQSQKVPSVCEACQPWRDGILENYTNKNLNIYWNNCRPSKWSSDKWEVAKAYMPRGNKAHNQIEQFDISALLNFMTCCKHFQKFVKKQLLTEVTSVRNQIMHSAEMKVERKEVEGHVKKILLLAKHLQSHVPEMEMLQQDIVQLQKTELSIIMGSLDPNCTVLEGDIENLVKMQNLEQQALKEKIEFLACCVEEGKMTNIEIEGMREFLDQNQDLLEKLRPQMEQLNKIQQKVDQHDQQLSVLTVKVDNLERINNEPVFTVDEMRYKNHLLEEATKNQWPAPVFSEIREPQGYKGQVEVNGQIFIGVQVHRSIKASHQEVSKLALEQLSAQGAASVLPHNQLGALNTTGSLFFSSVTVFLDMDGGFSEGPCENEELIESAYKNLATKFGSEYFFPGSSYKLAVQQYFQKCEFQQPEECFQSDANEKICCVLKLSGPFTFHGQEGSTKRKLAEQQAAKVALQKLSGLLGKKADPGDNYKGALKELLEARGLKPPMYKEKSNSEAVVTGAGPSTSQSVRAHQNEEPRCLPAEVTEKLQDKATEQSSVYVSPSEQCPPRKVLKLESSASKQFYVAVKVPVKRVVTGPEAETKEDAIQAVYTPLVEAFGLGEPALASPTSNIKELVLDFLKKVQCQWDEDYETTTEGKFTCKLDICGDFTFKNPEGTSRKQQAEQGAAKEALTRLAKFLDWDLASIGGNYKGKLQELLAKQGKMPLYENLERPGVTNPSDQSTENVFVTQVQRKLQILGFQPPYVRVEDAIQSTQFVYKLEIHLANYTFRNPQGFASKKAAIHNTYLKFAQAFGIYEKSTAENQSVKLVKEYFQKKHFDLPREIVEQEKDKFTGLLEVTSFSYGYEGKGLCEEKAKQEASMLALTRLAPLFGHGVTLYRSSSEDTKHRLDEMLKGVQQPEPSFQHVTSLCKVSANLLFSDFTLEAKDQNKKSARNKLCVRILGLLGEEDKATSISTSARNQVDDWFKKRKLSQPEFVDTNDGAKSTFSAVLSFSHPEWEPSVEAAEKKLVDEMVKRLRHLVEDVTTQLL